MVMGEKAELIYRLLTTPSSEYDICEHIDDDSIKIQFL